jgi:hypothetical protein
MNNNNKYAGSKNPPSWGMEVLKSPSGDFRGQQILKHTI